MVAFLIFLILFLLATPVAAEPVSIGTAILTAVGVSAATASTVIVAGITVAAVVGSAALFAVSIGIQYALQSVRDRPKRAGDTLPTSQEGRVPLRQTNPVRIKAYGHGVRIGGAYMAFEVAPDGRSMDVIALHQGKISAFLGFYLHDDPVEIDASGFVTTYPWGQFLPTYNSVPPVRILTRLGEETETNYPEVSLYIPTIWDANHRGDGIASLALICSPVPSQYFQKVYPNGLCVPSAVIDSSPVWDPRDVTQDREDSSTWQVSSNPVWQLVDYLLNDDYGLGYDYETAIAPSLDDLKFEADLCDALVPKIGGTEPRYRSSGSFRYDTEPVDVTGAILASCDGWLTEKGDGSISLKVGVYREPTVTFTDKHIVGFAVDFGTADEYVVNEINWNYTSIDHHYKDVPGDPWIVEDIVGKPRSTSMNLTWVKSHSQGRRLVKRAMNVFQAPMRGTFITKLYGLIGRGERWVRIQYPYVQGLEDAVIEIQKVNIDILKGRLSFSWILVDPDTIDLFDPVTEEGEAPSVTVEGGNVILPVPDNVVADISGEAMNASLIVFFDDPVRPELTYVTRYRVQDDGSGSPGPWVETVDTDPVVDGGFVTVTTGLVQTGFTYEVQVASIGAGDARSDWSDTAEVEVSEGENIYLVNRIYNPEFLVDQRGNASGLSINTTASNFFLDRWAAVGMPAAGVFTASRHTIVDFTGMTEFFQYSMRAEVTTSDAALGTTDTYFINQRFEGLDFADLLWGTVNAKSLVLTFWVRSSLTGDFSGSVSNIGAASRSYVFSFNIPSANVWRKVDVIIPGDTAQAPASGTSWAFRVLFNLGAGTDFLGAAGAWTTNILGATGSVALISTNGATLDIAGVRLTDGSSPVPFSSVRRDFQDELLRCKRYYEAMAVSTANGTIFVPFKNVKKSTPTVTASAGTVSGATVDGFNLAHTSVATSNVTASAEV
jgi:hypothetical protein